MDATALNSTLILLSWSVPEYPNGVIQQYTLSITDMITPFTVSVSGATLSTEIGGLDPFTTYYVTVYGRTVEDGLESEAVNVTTDESGEGGGH